QHGIVVEPAVVHHPLRKGVIGIVLDNGDVAALAHDAAHFRDERGPVLWWYVVHHGDSKGGVEALLRVWKALTLVDVVVDERMGSPRLVDHLAGNVDAREPQARLYGSKKRMHKTLTATDVQHLERAGTIAPRDHSGSLPLLNPAKQL